MAQACTWEDLDADDLVEFVSALTESGRPFTEIFCWLVGTLGAPREHIVLQLASTSQGEVWVEARPELVMDIDEDSVRAMQIQTCDGECVTIAVRSDDRATLG
jgi:hypothetical protein